MTYNEFLDSYSGEIESQDFLTIYESIGKEDNTYNSNWDKLIVDLLKLGVNPLEGLDRIPAYFFSNNTKIKSIKIPETIRSIDIGAFNNSGIEEVIVPDLVMEVYDWAFNECNNLKKAILGEGLMSIGNRVFKGCKNLTEVHIKNPDLEEIGSRLFENCLELKDIYFNGTLAQWRKIMSISNDSFNTWNYFKIKVHCKDGICGVR